MAINLSPRLKTFQTFRAQNSTCWRCLNERWQTDISSFLSILLLMHCVAAAALCRQRALTLNNSQISLMCVMKKSSLHPGSSIARLSRRATGPLRCLSSAAPPTHLSSLSGRGEEGARRLPPSLIFTSVAALTPWQLKGGDLTYPDAVVTLRCPEKPWPLRADGGAALWRPKTRAVPNIVLVEEQTRAQVQGLITGCLSVN